MSDIRFMRRALELAQKGAGQTSPNPLVGAVIVRNGRIVAEGFHRRAGLPHAEIEALKKISFKANNATLYCNLEPCFHYGRTPPCVHRIIKSGIKRVVIAHRDPNPLTAGKSIRLLKKSGIKVTEGVLKKEALWLNRFYLTWITRQRPYVILKIAMSLDGKIAPPPHPGPLPKGARGNKWITGPIARRRVHEIRSQVDAILVGVNTVIADDPRLNVRGVKGAKQPVRIILGRRGGIPRNAKIFKSRGGPVWIIESISKPSLSDEDGSCPRPPPPCSELLRAAGGPLPRPPAFPPLAEGVLKGTLQTLATKGITSVLVEGGGEIFRSFLGAGLVDELILHVAPKILGPGALALFTSPLAKIFGPSFKRDYVGFQGPDLEIAYKRKVSNFK